MPFDAPAPFALHSRRAEDREVISLRVADITARLRFFEFFENHFEAHDRRGLVVTELAESGLEHGMCELPLLGVHFLDLQALARVLGNEVPIEPLLAVEGEIDLRHLGGR